MCGLVALVLTSDSWADQVDMDAVKVLTFVPGEPRKALAKTRSSMFKKPSACIEGKLRSARASTRISGGTRSHAFGH